MYNNLKTPYTVDEIPYNIYPRPQLKRDSFINLNGKWDFSVETKKEKTYLCKITVPFVPEAQISGINRITTKNETIIYERKFQFESTNKRTILHFGAVDCETDVYLNGNIVGSHKGGYLPFSFEVTDYVKSGENTITVKVRDDLDPNYPYGKQKHKRGGMWYTPISGIWQTVWLECVPQEYIEKIIITPSKNSVTIKTIGGIKDKTLKLEGNIYNFSGDTIKITPENPQFWTPENPHLYYFSIKSGEDEISSYFALRDISIEKIGEIFSICLNKKPYYFHGLLDQGYFADGIYLPANEQGFKDDVLKMKELGFNMLRKHIKIEPEIFYYYCDLYGMAVFQDMVNNGKYSFILDTALPTISFKRFLSRPASKKRKEIFIKSAEETTELLYNHPSVVYYTIFNEGWGQHNATKIYRKLKQIDNTRVWDTASGWFKDCESDVVSEHIYFKPIKIKKCKDKPIVISEFGGYSHTVKNHTFNTGNSYGYKKCKDRNTFMNDLEKLYIREVLPSIKKGVCATVLTQVSDVEDETNGLITYDRKALKVDKERMVRISKTLKEAFENTTEK